MNDLFRGANAITLDAKGRLTMPARYRDEFVARSAGQLVITLGVTSPCLSIYTLDSWAEVEAKVLKLPSIRPDSSRLQRLLIGNAVDIELDSHGRFVVPPLLRSQCKLDKRVMLVGQLNKLQLWDEDAWQSVMAEDLLAFQQPGALPDDLQDLIL